MGRNLSWTAGQYQTEQILKAFQWLEQQQRQNYDDSQNNPQNPHQYLSQGVKLRWQGSSMLWVVTTLNDLRPLLQQNGWDPTVDDIRNALLCLKELWSVAVS